MARRLEKWSRIEVRAVIRFLWAKNVAASEIHRQIVEVYGDKAMSRQQVARWCRSYQAGREHVENRNMEASGRRSSSRTDIKTARAEEIIQRDQRVTVREIASELDLSYGNVQRIVTDELRYSKVCACWVPRALSAEHKAIRMICSLHFFSDTIQTANTSFASLPVMKHGFITSPPYPKEPRWSGNTLDHRRGRSLRSHPLLVK
ncbi:uncharacterized protein LOC118188881 [Stegodyphus dumicola]|uniref:uncharacterized protein LOC118188881 n=1 Tax=Stegodyphus dumicola TaxID=202533 RepID=UPI0015AB91ED|nr:uncharacterized protein LOC118188881 [Stegodyphus dumicola]